MRSAAYAKMQRLIREVVPAKPSTLEVDAGQVVEIETGNGAWIVVLEERHHSPDRPRPPTPPSVPAGPLILAGGLTPPAPQLL